MTPIADMVRRMLEKGVDHEAILIAIEGAEQAALAQTSTRHPPDSATEKRRAWDREYRRNKRVIPPDSTRHPPDPPDTTLSKSILREEKEEREGTPHRCPPDFSPSLEDRGFAKAEGFAETEIDREVSKFRDYWISVPGSRGVKLDWSPMWRKWIRDGADRMAKAKPPPTQPTTANGFDWDAVVKMWRRTGYWSPQAGPDPESPSCRCPREILEKHAILEMKAAE
jgi:hypothetical protein